VAVLNFGLKYFMHFHPEMYYADRVMSALVCLQSPEAIYVNQI
jgi:hypothetical protein